MSPPLTGDDDDDDNHTPLKFFQVKSSLNKLIDRIRVGLMPYNCMKTLKLKDIPKHILERLDLQR